MKALTNCIFVLCVAVAAQGFALGPSQIVFHLFTRNNPQLSEPLLPTQNSILTSNQFSNTRPSIITIHNFGEGVGGNFNAFLVRDHLAAQDVNLFAVDWSPGSFKYAEGLGNAPQVGQVIANFINIFAEFGYGPNNFRIVGVGLGGHIAGIAARKVNGDIPHIVAIDPSLVGWTHHPDKLKASDAGVVEVLHTTAGSMGYDLPLGTLDFYPNGGANQNGCADVTCSHILGYVFYAESMLTEINESKKFVGTKCENYDQARANQCSGERGAVFGGSAVKTSEEGIYTFTTNFVSPYAQG